VQGEVDLRCVWDAQCLLGEGPIWDDRSAKLYFVDIKGETICSYDDRNGGSSTSYPGGPTALALIDGSDDLLCASGRGLERFRPANEARRDELAPLPLGDGMRPNDGKCDPAGRFWIGTMDDREERFAGTLYRYDPSGGLATVLPAIGVSNGLDWSPDGRIFYYTDSMRHTIWRFGYDVSSGTLSDRQDFVRLDPGGGAPDGLTVDAEGYVWSAHWDGWRIARYAPDGSIDRILPAPVPRPTSVAFGGPDLATLYVTSARIGLSADQLAEAPLSGALFACEPGVRGLAPHRVRL
jgi:sugar lactone lactonase YvrE